MNAGKNRFNIIYILVKLIYNELENTVTCLVLNLYCFIIIKLSVKKNLEIVSGQIIIRIQVLKY